MKPLPLVRTRSRLLRRLDTDAAAATEQDPCNALHGSADPASEAPPSPLPGDLQQIVYWPISRFRPGNGVLRLRTSEDHRRFAIGMETHKVARPIFATAGGEVVYGHDTLEALKILDRSEAPVIVVDDRSPAELEALKIWFEAFDAAGEWNNPLLNASLKSILDEQPDLLSSIFFDCNQVDLILHGALAKAPEKKEKTSCKFDDADPPPVTQSGDIFVWSRGHRLICGDAREGGTYERLMGETKAQIVIADPPYGLAVGAFIPIHGKWKQGSGMTEEETTAFLTEAVGLSASHMADGAIAFWFIDWRGMYSLLHAVRQSGLVQKSLCTWDKIALGKGSFYRNQSEHVVVAKYGSAPHVFNRKSSQTSTIWTAPGYGCFRPDREEALAAHACTKPQSILMGALLACSKIGFICLDPFSG